MAQLDERFSTFALPFLYDDHQHLSLALNSEELLGRLNTGLQPRGIRLLNAFYSGSAFLVSTKGELRTPSDYKGIAAALRTDNADKLAVFSSLGARVLPYSASAIPNMLGAQAELLPEGADGPAEEVTVDTIEVDTEQALALEADPNTLFFIKSYHAAAPLWLGANEQSLASLTDYERAVLSEACAGCSPGSSGSIPTGRRRPSTSCAPAAWRSSRSSASRFRRCSTTAPATSRSTPGGTCRRLLRPQTL